MSEKKDTIRAKLLKKIEQEQLKRADIQKSGKRDQEPNLLNISHALDQYYMLEKLRLYCSYLSYQNMIHDNIIQYEKNDFRLMPAILELLQHQDLQLPAIAIYYKLSQLFGHMETAHIDPTMSNILFSDIEALIEQHGNEFAPGELVEIHSHLTNYAVHQMNYGNDDYLIKNIRHNLNLIKQQESAHQQFVISSGVYKNMVLLILKANIAQIQQLETSIRPEQLQETADWALEFAKKYRPFLPASSRVKYYRYCRALIDFHRGTYRQAFEWIKQLQRVREVFINFNIRVLQLQLLLELEIEDERILDREEIIMEDEIEKLRNMLRHDRDNNPKLSYHDSYFWNFLNLFRKFYLFFNKYAWRYRFADEEYHHKRGELKNEILKVQYSYREWFLQKLEAIN